MILIVDDEEPLARIYCNILEAHGFEAERVGMGGYALSIISRKKPELVIVDLLLRDMNGIELAEKAREEGYDGPFVLISGNVELGDDLKFLTKRMENFDFAEKYQKPIHTSELVEAAERYAKKKKQE